MSELQRDMGKYAGADQCDLRAHVTLKSTIPEYLKASEGKADFPSSAADYLAGIDKKIEEINAQVIAIGKKLEFVLDLREYPPDGATAVPNANICDGPVSKLDNALFTVHKKLDAIIVSLKETYRRIAL